jgi:broad specificity phosphatase PhoE
MPGMPPALDNPKPQPAAAPATPSAGTNGDKLVIVMVGLPARGKTFIGRKIARYLEFFKGAPTAVFNAGEYRRKAMGTTHGGPTHDFFDPANPEHHASRMQFAKEALDDLKVFLGDSNPYNSQEEAGNPTGRVAVFDATNTTRARRSWLVQELLENRIVESKSHILFIESICDDEQTIDINVRSTKLRNPDYAGWDADKAVADFTDRIQHYEARYEPIAADVSVAKAAAAAAADAADGLAPESPTKKSKRPRSASWHYTDENELSYIKLINGEQVVLNRINGYLQTTIVQFTMNLHTIPHVIHMSRHGQSEYNLVKKLGGDSSITPHGVEYSVALAKWADEEVLAKNPHARLWTSSLKRTKETASRIRHDVLHEADGGQWITMRPRQWNALDELHAGIFDGMTYAEIEAAAPEEFAMRKADKMTYRYPRGESYFDVIQRLDPIVQELERMKDPVLIVAHQGILRILYAYFQGMPRERSPHLSMPLNTIKTITPHAYGCDEVDTVLLKQIDVSSH